MMLVIALSCFGCRTTAVVSWWRPQFAKPVICPAEPSPLQLAEEAYAEGWRLEQAGDSACIEQFGAAAALAWPFAWGFDASGPEHRGADLYRSAVGRFVEASQRFKQFDSQQGVATGAEVIPVSYYGFPWRPNEFHEFTLVGDYCGVTRKKARCCGVGAPLVVTCNTPCCDDFRLPQEHFAATAVIRPTDNEEATSPYVLEFYDPVRVLNSPNFDEPLARDLTAPLSYGVQRRGNAGVRNFFFPGSTNSDQGLYAMEPYQPGKIPVVFIHGLLSDTQVWLELYNELRRHPDIVARYQFMAVEYPTSVSFLATAARLRTELCQYRNQIDPERRDDALSQSVLIGHSMGGLIGKLQAVDSGTDLWDAVADRPFEQMQGDAEVKRHFGKQFFFCASPDVRRVIAIGTPWRGSPLARRPIGRTIARLVVQPRDEAREFHEFKRANRGVFRNSYLGGLPISVDLLRYNNPLLLAIRGRPMAPWAPLNIVYGLKTELGVRGPNDGVVPVESALAPSETSRLVEADHLSLQKDDETIAEILCLLLNHAPETKPPAGDALIYDQPIGSPHPAERIFDSPPLPPAELPVPNSDR